MVSQLKGFHATFFKYLSIHLLKIIWFAITLKTFPWVWWWYQYASPQPKQTKKPWCQQFLHRRSHDFGDNWAHTFLGSFVQLHRIHMLLALCKSMLYKISFSLIRTPCLVQFDIKLYSMYTHLCCIHCAYISSTPIQGLHCFVETWGAHTLLGSFMWIFISSSTLVCVQYTWLSSCQCRLLL